MGLYTFVFDSASNLDVVPLIPFGVGLVLGVVATSGGMEVLMKKFKRQTYLAVMGFVIGSVGSLAKDALGRVISTATTDTNGTCYQNILGGIVKYETESGDMEIVRTAEQLAENGFVMQSDLTVLLWIVCGLLAVAGFIAVYTLSVAEDKKSEENN
jgi:hypothetical protein